MPRAGRLIALGILLSPVALHAQAADPFAGCARLAGAIAGPYALVSINGWCTDLTSQIIPFGNGAAWTISANTPYGITNMRLSASFVADPFITFGASTTNAVAGPVTYTFLFSTPIVPAAYSAATATAGVTVTNGAGGTAIVSPAASQPTFVRGIGLLGATPTVLGADVGATPCQAGPGAPATRTQTCNYGTASASFPSLTFDNLRAVLSYTQTDQSSVASWSGAITLTPASVVPEPPTVSLLAAGVLGLVGVNVRRRSRAVVR